MPMPAVLAYYGVGVREKIVADLYAAIDDDMRQQHGVLPDHDILVDDHVGPDVRIASNSRAGMHDCCRMYAGSVAQRLMEEFEGTGEALVGILDAQRGGWDGGKVFGDDHGCGFGEPRRGARISDWQRM